MAPKPKYVPFSQLAKTMADDELDFSVPYDRIKFFWDYARKNRAEVCGFLCDCASCVS